jgi:hypothetical protein
MEPINATYAEHLIHDHFPADGEYIITNPGPITELEVGWKQLHLGLDYYTEQSVARKKPTQRARAQRRRTRIKGLKEAQMPLKKTELGVMNDLSADFF